MTSEENTEELGPSKLGTLDFWENAYSLELENFKSHGDVGEIWFGKGSSLNVVKWICTKSNLDKENDAIVDIGCGNGMMLVELAKRGFKQLVGVDYSRKAIDLANEVLKENKVASKLQVCDIISDNHGLSKNYFKIVHDKGTYDAISLHPEDPVAKRDTYIKNTYDILAEDGYLILTSCNWTKEELLNHFKNSYDLIDELPVNSFQFGGKKGNRITQLIFKKK